MTRWQETRALSRWDCASFKWLALAEVHAALRDCAISLAGSRGSYLRGDCLGARPPLVSAARQVGGYWRAQASHLLHRTGVSCGDPRCRVGGSLIVLVSGAARDRKVHASLFLRPCGSRVERSQPRAPHTPSGRVRPRCAPDSHGGPPPYILVGHSGGGYFSTVYTSEHLDRVVGLVLVDAVGFNKEEHQRFSALNQKDYEDEDRARGRAIALMPIGIPRLLGWCAELPYDLPQFKPVRPALTAVSCRKVCVPIRPSRDGGLSQ